MRHLILIAALLISTPALAQEDASDEAPAPEATPDPTNGGNEALAPGEAPLKVEAPVFDAGIHVIPPGALITMPPQWVTDHNLRSAFWTVEGKSFLLPEPMYNTALTKAKQLDICRPALDHCTEVSLEWMRKADEALGACQEQMDSDETLVTDLTGRITDLDNRLATSELKLHRQRTATGVSWAITSGVVVGLVTTAIIASTLDQP